MAFQMFRRHDRIQLEGKTSSELFEGGERVMLLGIPSVLIISAVALLPFLRVIFLGQIKNGVPVEASVLKARDTGISINDNPQVRLLLEVTPSMSRPSRRKPRPSSWG